jgi:hypothetical protein
MTTHPKTGISVLVVLLALSAFTFSKAEDVRIELGTEAEARRLFSYPNKGHESQPLEQTIEHYMRDAISRESAGALTVKVETYDARYRLRIVGTDHRLLLNLQSKYQEFIDTAALGLKLFDSFKNAGNLDPKWQFLVPLGVPVHNARAVEIMDFPPTSLIARQDYYNSKTTNRWWDLLAENGVPDSEKYLYSCILDIVPVAAPASDGRKLDESGIYEGAFDDYSLRLLRLMGGDARPRPLMALGAPIRKWMKRLWGVDLKVLDVAKVTVNNRTYPIIASNHPSFFFYAVRSYTSGPDKDKKNFAAGLAVLRQDIVAAAWHAAMGQNPDGDPHTVLTACIEKWRNRDADLAAIVRKHAGFSAPFSLSVADSLPEILRLAPTTNELKSLEEQFSRLRAIEE